MSYVGNAAASAAENANFRTVLFTGSKSQLVAMRIPPGGEVGEETHDHVEQTLFVMEGKGTAVVDGVESEVGPGGVIVVTPGTRHNVLNRGEAPLSIITIYAPPNHIDGRVHATKADADADREDEEFGHAAR